MSTKHAVISICIAAVIGVAIGRFSLPAKVVTKTETVEVDKKLSQTDSNKQDHKIVTIVETKKPDGTVTKTTTIKDDSTQQSNTKISEQDNKDSKSSKEVTYNTQRWSISALAVDRPANVSSAEIAYGAHVQYRILGPFTVGGMVLTDKTVGVSLGITF